MATVYSDRGHGVRAPVVFYNRCNEAAAQLKPGDFDWKAIFAGGVRWFHSGGIFAALSETTAELIIEGMQAAKAAGAVVVVRPELSARSSGTSGAATAARRRRPRAHRRARGRARRQRGGPAEGPRHSRARRSRPTSKLDPSAFFGDDRRGRREASRRSRSSRRRCARCTRPTATAGARWRGSTARRTLRRPASSTCYDRVGGGDGFASGFFYGLLTGETPEEAREARLGARRAAHHVPRRHDDGDGRAGAGVRQGRLGADSALAIRRAPVASAEAGRCRSPCPRRRRRRWRRARRPRLGRDAAGGGQRPRRGRPHRRTASMSMPCISPSCRRGCRGTRRSTARARAQPPRG